MYGYKCKVKLFVEKNIVLKSGCMDYGVTVNTTRIDFPHAAVKWVLSQMLLSIYEYNLTACCSKMSIISHVTVKCV